jgi:hypothetical protein
MIRESGIILALGLCFGGILGAEYIHYTIAKFDSLNAGECTVVGAGEEGEVQIISDWYGPTRSLNLMYLTIFTDNIRNRFNTVRGNFQGWGTADRVSVFTNLFVLDSYAWRGLNPGISKMNLEKIMLGGNDLGNGIRRFIFRLVYNNPSNPRGRENLYLDIYDDDFWYLLDHILTWENYEAWMDQYGKADNREAVFVISSLDGDLIELRHDVNPRTGDLRLVFNSDNSTALPILNRRRYEIHGATLDSNSDSLWRITDVRNGHAYIITLNDLRSLTSAIRGAFGGNMKEYIFQYEAIVKRYVYDNILLEPAPVRQLDRDYQRSKYR